MFQRFIRCACFTRAALGGARGAFHGVSGFIFVGDGAGLSVSTLADTFSCGGMVAREAITLATKIDIGRT
jgi:hypothetical protein